MQETEAESLHRSGKITAAERVSVSNINGHRGQTALSTYVKHDRFDDVENILKIQDKAQGNLLTISILCVILQLKLIAL
jgi:hypothetical protein